MVNVASSQQQCQCWELATFTISIEISSFQTKRNSQTCADLLAIGPIKDVLANNFTSINLLVAYKLDLDLYEKLLLEIPTNILGTACMLVVNSDRKD